MTRATSFEADVAFADPHATNGLTVRAIANVLDNRMVLSCRRWHWAALA
jgi:hypothetical protein